jgi:hypothetical protein
MLRRDIRKKIKEQNLLSYIAKDSNPSQTKIRIRRQCRQAIEDLALIAGKSSASEIDEIFNLGLIRNLLMSLLVLDYTKSITLRSPNAKLASIFAEIGIDICVKEYEIKHKETPFATELIVEHLTKAVGICREIGLKSISDYIDDKIKDINGEYICNFDELYQENYVGDFGKYIKEEMRIDPDFFKMEVDPASESSSGHQFRIYSELSIPEGEFSTENEFLGIVDINFNKAEQKGTITFLDKDKKRIKSVSFVVEVYFSRKCVIHKKSQNRRDSIIK